MHVPNLPDTCGSVGFLDSLALRFRAQCFAVDALCACVRSMPSRAVFGVGCTHGCLYADLFYCPVLYAGGEGQEC